MSTPALSTQKHQCQTPRRGNLSGDHRPATSLHLRSFQCSSHQNRTVSPRSLTNKRNDLHSPLSPSPVSVTKSNPPAPSPPTEPSPSLQCPHIFSSSTLPILLSRGDTKRTSHQVHSPPTPPGAPRTGDERPPGAHAHVSDSCPPPPCTCNCASNPRNYGFSILPSEATTPCQRTPPKEGPCRSDARSGLSGRPRKKPPAFSTVRPRSDHGRSYQPAA